MNGENRILLDVLISYSENIKSGQMRDECDIMVGYYVPRGEFNFWEFSGIFQYHANYHSVLEEGWS